MPFPFLDVYNIHPDILGFAAKLGLLTSGSYGVISFEGLRL